MSLSLFTVKALASGQSWRPPRDKAPPPGQLPGPGDAARTRLIGDLDPFPPTQATISRRSVLVVRHGERVDQVFGKSWLQQCTTPDGRSSPGRPPAAWHEDPSQFL